MLQQTQTSRVIEPWTRFLELFPTPTACADAPLAAVLTAWRGLGYHRRAKALHDAATMVRDEFAGVVPREPNELRRLPGVGEYTSAAVASFAYGEPVAVLDTNVGRVLARALANRRLLPREARALASAVLGRGASASFNQAMIDLGATYCRSSPRCSECPVAKVCAWRNEGGDDPAPLSAAVSRRQARFEGSNRQLRGRVLESLRDDTRTKRELNVVLGDVDARRGDEVLEGLVRDGLIAQRRARYSLPHG
jgi:A/G-specific adenine glycosylase